MAVFLTGNVDQCFEKMCSDQHPESDFRTSRVFLYPMALHTPSAWSPWEVKYATKDCGSEGSSLEDSYAESEVENFEALQSGDGDENEFSEKTNPFALTPGQMGKMFNPKALCAFHALGGIAGIQKGLRSVSKTGLTLSKEHIDGRISFKQTAASEGSNTTSRGYDFSNICRAQDLVCQHGHEVCNSEDHNSFDWNTLSICKQSPSRHCFTPLTASRHCKLIQSTKM